MSYYVLLDLSTDLSDPSLLIQFDESVVINGLAQLEQLKFSEDCQIVRVHHSVIDKQNMRPDEILAHYPNLATAIEQERDQDRQDLSQLAGLLIDFLIDSDASDSISDIASYAVACISSADSFRKNPRSLDTKALGFTKNKFNSAFSKTLGSNDNDVTELYANFAYAQQIFISKQYAKSNGLVQEEISIIEEFLPHQFSEEFFKRHLDKIKASLETETAYLISDRGHSYFVIFEKKENSYFLITKIELDIFSYTPERSTQMEENEYEAYITLFEKLYWPHFNEGNKPISLDFSLLKLTIKPEQLITVFEEFDQEFKRGYRVWGKQSIFQKPTLALAPSQRNCHSFVYSMLQMLVAQRTSEASKSPSLCS